MTLRVALPEERYTAHQLPDTYRAILDRIEQVAGVESVAATSALPSIGGRGSTTVAVAIEGRPITAPRDRPWAIQVAVTSGYFQALRIPLLSGRVITDDDRAGTLPVAVVSRSMQRRYFADRDPVGERLQAGRSADSAEWLTIVGVVDDVRADNRRGAPAPYLYVAMPQRPARDVAVVISTATAPLSLAPALRDAIQQIDRDITLRDITTLDQFIEQGLGPTAIYASIMIVFAAAALLLTLVGLYGVVAFSVSRRTQEIGIRMALGAAPRDVLTMVLRQSLTLAVIGMVVGLVLGYGLSRALSSALYGVGVNSTDVMLFAAVGGVLAACAMMASYLPARRAARVDPLVALRYE